MAGGRLTLVMLTFSTVVVVGFLTWSVYPYLLDSGGLAVDGGSSSNHLAVYKVDGMTCGGCEIAVDRAITATGLVDSVKSSFVEGRAYIWYSDSDVSLDEFKSALASVGYEAALIEQQKENKP